MLMKKLIAIFLAALMLMSTFTLLVQAKDSEETTNPASKYTYKTTNQKPTLDDYQTGKYTDPVTKETIIVDTEYRARQMKQRYLDRPDVIYRGMVALLSGKMEFLFT